MEIMQNMSGATYKPALQFVSSKALSAHYPPLDVKSLDDKILSTLHFTEHVMPNRVIMLCERSATPQVHYVSAGSRKILGYEASVLKAMPLTEFLTLIHPDDIAHVMKCFTFMNEFEPYNPLVYRFDLRYRLRHKNGEYLHVSNEKMTIASNGTHMYLAIFSVIAPEEKFHGVNLSVFQNISGVNRKIHTYHPRQDSTGLTPRQLEMARLVRKGLTNREIADLLNISVHTVKHHKSLLFRKAKVKRSIELTSVAARL